MARQRPGVALNAALAGGDVGEGPSRSHVTGLALLALAARRALEPFRVGAVHVYAEEDAFVTGGTVPAFAVQGRVTEGLAHAEGVVQGPEKELLLIGGAEEPQAVAAEAGADLVGRRGHALVAVIPVTPSGAAPTGEGQGGFHGGIG